MKDNDKINKQQITEVEELQQRIAELESANSWFKQMETALKNSEERFRALTEEAPIGIYYSDLKGTFLYGNKKAETIVGYTNEELRGKSFLKLQLISPKDIVRSAKLLRLNNRGKSTGPDEFVINREDGTQKIVEINTSVVTLSEKKAVISMVQDITERKQAEKALREGEERFRLLADNAPFGISIMAPDRSFVYFNPMFTVIFGYAKEDISDKDTWFAKAYPDAEYRKKVSSLWKRDRDEDVKIGEENQRIFTVRCKNGQNKIIDFRSVHLGDGKQYLFYEDITDRAMTEEALKHSEERYRTLVENIDLGINLIDANHNIIMVNATQSKRFKKSINEMIGKKCFRVFQQRDSVCQNCIGIKAMATGQPVEVEAEGVRDGQSHAQIRVQAFPALGQDGTATAFIVIVEDITERKQMEQELRESEERYRTLYEDNPSMYLTVNAEGTVLSVNQFGAEQLGYTVKELVGQPVLNVFCEDDKEAVQQQFTTCIQNPTEVFHWEFRKVRKDGNIMWVKEAARAVRNIDGKLVVLIVCEDISERKLMEEALRQSEANLKKAQEVGHVGSWHLDLKKKELIWSDETCRIFGIPQETVLTYEEFLEAVHPDDREYVDKAWTAVFDKELYDIEHRIVVNGEVKWVREKAEVELNDKIKGIRATGTVQDITEKKRADKELKKSFDRLRKSLESTISALASALEVRDPYTAGHQQRVTDLACAIAEEMGLTEEQIDGIRMAGFIHDIGKINIPAEILNKPGPLSDIEYSLFKNHPQVGYDVLKNVEFPWPVAQIVFQHHERFDGSGYPQGLSGDEIILEARILAVADIVEAIASHRPYRPARGAGDALEEILHNKGTLYDPEVVDACLRVFYDKGFKFEQTLKVATSPKIH